MNDSAQKSPNDRIAAGIAEPLKDLPAGPSEFLSVAELEARVAESTAALDRYRRLAFNLDETVKAAQARANDATAVLTDKPRSEREALAKKLFGAARDEIVRNSAGPRAETLKPLLDLAERVKAQGELYKSPTQLLAREGIGTSALSDALKVTERAGPTQIQGYVAYAIATKNRVLGNAIFARLDSMSPDARRSLGEGVRERLAENLLGEDFRRARRALRTIANRASEGRLLNKQFESGRASANDLIALGLAKRDEA